jgi:hypothetical protein
MREVTAILNHYRSVSRTICNAGYWTQPQLRNWDSVDSFNDIRKLLFDSLVVAALKIDGACDIQLSAGQIPALRIVPLHAGPVPILIHRPREGDRNNYWDDPVKEIMATDAELHFLDYFDWNQMDFVDFQYYRVRIVKFSAHPHLVGREALLEHQYAKVFAPDINERLPPVE